MLLRRGVWVELICTASWLEIEGVCDWVFLIYRGVPIQESGLMYCSNQLYETMVKFSCLLVVLDTGNEEVRKRFPEIERVGARFHLEHTDISIRFVEYFRFALQVQKKGRGGMNSLQTAFSSALSTTTSSPTFTSPPATGNP